jgi:hypothetical protein
VGGVVVMSHASHVTAEPGVALFILAKYINSRALLGFRNSKQQTTSRTLAPSHRSLLKVSSHAASSIEPL